MKIFFFKIKNKQSLLTRGFTLIEFVIILSIFAIMAAIALANFKGFNNDVALNNLAQDIALTIRQAQVFGWSTTSATGTNGAYVALDPITGNPLRFADGVYFGYGNDVSGAFDSEFNLYTKNDSTIGNEYFVSPTSSQANPDTVTDTVKIQGTARISAICTANDVTDEGQLLPFNRTIPTSCNNFTDGLSIAFSRPRPGALFFKGPLNSLGSPLTGVQFVNIYISATNDAPGVADHIITVSSIGEITVQ